MEIRSDITGTVIEIVAPVGTSVRQGDAVVKLESMKMEILLTAPRSGKIVEMRVGEGDAVKEDAVFAVMEPDAG